VPVEGGIRSHLVLPGEQQLEAVVSGVGELVETDDSARVEGVTAAQAAGQRVAFGEPAQDLTRLLGHCGIGGLGHDRCDRPIDVGEHRRPLRMLTERRNQGVEPAVVCAAFLCAPAIHAL
jgi:hypothetical protein